MAKDTTPQAVRKVAIITGAAHRIGASITKNLHQSGMNVVLHYRHSHEEAQCLCHDLNAMRPHSAITLQADLHHAESWQPLIEKSQQQWGRLDLLVNNASSFYPTKVANVTEAIWDELVSSNLKTPFFLSQAAAPHLKKHQGSIVNIVDIHAERPLKNHPVYSIAKAGLVMMTKSLACELGPEIRVNGVAPGAILWPDHNMDDETRQRIISRTFLQRQGEANNIAEAVLFLARNAPYTTGHILTVDGGRSLNS
ncbi:MAG: pteridine reductase [Gammaproteobacteria bacterium]|nr:pteridine reductase [Gammaproteobacteria bacterium]MCF6231402.1 pteridine reductase [Gammaproteobacteria bacterium]